MDKDGRVFPQLPPGFRFGTSTASYQIEGAASEDGKGPSIWDTFTAEPGRIADGSTGDVACDHYHRWPEDVALMKRPRRPAATGSRSRGRGSMPDRRGRVNPRGLAFYDRLVDGLLEAGIEPMATLYHWDLPQGLQDDGGWLNRDTIDRFADYADIVGSALGDRVAHWIPINEPNVVTLLGHGTRHARTRPGAALRRAPGRPPPAASPTAAPRSRCARAGATSVGCANNHAPIWPASDSDADVGAAKLFDALWNGMYLEAMLLGRYPTT